MENELATSQNAEAERKMNAYLKSVLESNTSPEKKETAVKKIRSNGLFHITGKNPVDELSGVCIDGIHYYDFHNIQYINNTGMASLIDLLKCLLEQGVKVQFVNVNDKIKSKIKSMGLESILNCS